METARLYVYRLTAASRNTSLFPEGGRLAKVYHSWPVDEQLHL